jgi:hypothetical protein
MWRESLVKLWARLESSSSIENFSLFGYLGLFGTPSASFLADGEEMSVEFPPDDDEEHDVNNSEVLEASMKFINFIQKRHSKTLCRLEISEFAVDSDQAAAISQLITSVPRLSTVVLRQIQIGNSEFEIICKAISCCSTVVEVEITTHEENPSNMDVMFSQLLQSNKSLSTVKWTVDQATQLPQCMFANAVSFTAISELNLTFSVIVDVGGLCSMIRSNNFLAKLVLTGLKTSEAGGIRQIFSAIQESTIEVLNLILLRLTSEDLLGLGEMVKTARRLTSLEFGSYVIKEDETPLLKSILSSITRDSPISKLHFVKGPRGIIKSGNLRCLSSDQLANLLNAKNCRYVLLSRMAISHGNAELLSDAIYKETFFLEELWLPHSSWEDETDMESIIRAQRPTCSLHTLNLGLVSSLTAIKLFGELRINKNLEYFGIEPKEKHFDDFVFKAMLATIRDNSALSDIYAGDFNMGSQMDQSTVDLDNAWKENYSLTSLYAEPCRFSPEACQRNQKMFQNRKKTILLHVLKQFNASSLDKYVINSIFQMAHM